MTIAPRIRAVLRRWTRRTGATAAALDTLVLDVRYGARALRAAPGYAAWVVGSLAIGMAVTIAATALLNASMILPFPGVTEQKRLVRVAISRGCGRPDCWSRMAAPADYDALRDGLTGLQGLAAYDIGDVAAVSPEARTMRAVIASADYFDVLGVRPAIGRTFHHSDADTHAAVAVIAHTLWKRDFDADPSVVGTSIRVGNRFVQIVGVAPEMFVGVDRPGAARSISAGPAPEIWLPLWLADGVLPPPHAEPRGQQRVLSFIGRLRDGVELPELQAEAEVASARRAAASGSGSQGSRAEVRQVWRVSPRSWRFGIFIVMPIPILILAIACVNAASLMLARGSQRRREIAIRLAIGAGRARIVRQLLVESALLAAIATAVAIPIAWWSLRVASSPLNVPMPIDGTVLAAAVLAAIVTTAAFGLAPAIRATAQDPASALGPGIARSDASPRQSRTRRGLVVAQAALSLGLLATGSQLVSTVRAQAVSAGTPPHRLLLARFDLRPLGLAPAAAESFYRDLMAGTARLPGVEAAGLARHASVWTFGRGSDASLVVWRPTDGRDDGQVTIGGYAGGDLFNAIGLRVVAGRPFSEADREPRPRVAIVNQTAALHVGGAVIGSLLRVAPRGRSYDDAIEVRVVGVVEPSIEPRLEPDERPAAKVYLPSPLEAEPALTMYVRTRDAAATIARPMRDLVRRIAPQVPIVELGSLEEVNERSYGMQLWLARAAAVLGLIGLLLATAGLYGVSSYVVALRSREVAIRMAVGAPPQAIVAMILAQSMKVAAVGLVGGGAGSIAVSRVIQSEYHGIHGIDPAALGGAVALFVAAMLVASGVPAIRASRVDPVEQLK